jgi:hypothetical protein
LHLEICQAGLHVGLLALQHREILFVGLLLRGRRGLLLFLTTAKTILRYVVGVEGREFDVVIASDGTSHWMDQAKCSLMGQIRDECPAFGISLPASKEILVKASEIRKSVSIVGSRSRFSTRTKARSLALSQ